MVLAFMFGGFLLTTYAFTAYSTLWGSDISQPPHNESVNGSRDGVNESSDQHRFSREVPGMPPFIPRRVLGEGISPLEMLTSPFMMFSLIGGLISIGSGISIRNLMHKKQIRKVKEDLTELYLTEEEKKVMSHLESVESEMTQKELTDRTGYSRVKVHRIIQKLEAKKLVRKIPYGQTNKIILER